jgi:hypothetical protein
MNAVSYAVSTIKQRINREILNLAYLTDYGQIETIESIIEGVIKRRPMVDSNLMSGTAMMVRLYEEYVFFEDEYGNKTIQLPKDILGGKSITAAHSIIRQENFTETYRYTEGTRDTGDILDAATLMYDNSSMPFTVVTANLSVIGDKTIAIMDNIGCLDNLNLKLMVSNNAIMNNLDNRAKMTFMKLCTLAVKADIYNKTIIKIDEGELVQGHNLGRIKSIIESYSDADEQYYDYFEDKWRKVMHMADPVLSNGLIKTAFPNNA